MAADYRQRMVIDENMFLACRIYRRVFAKWDKEAKKVPGTTTHEIDSEGVATFFLLH